MSNLSIKMSNAIFILLLIEYVYLKDIPNLKQTNIISPVITQTNNLNSSYLKENKTNLERLNKKKITLEGFNSESSEYKSAENTIRERDKSIGETISSNRNDDFNPFGYYEKMKSHFEQYMIIIINFLHELMKSPQENITESDSSLLTFDVKIFPYIKLISFIAFIILLGIVFKNILQILTKEKENYNGKRDSENSKSFVITLPNLPEKTTTENVVKLQGRIKRNPNPINYNKLFDSKKSLSQKAKQNNLLTKTKFDELSKNKRINDNKQENENKPKKEKEQILCGFDDLLDYIPKQENPIIENLVPISNESIMIENPNLIMFEEKTEIIYATLHEPQLQLEERNLFIGGEIDDRTKLIQRLIQGNFIEKTAITNFRGNKNK